MDELQKLLDVLKGNIEPRLQEQLLASWDMLDDANKESILEGLRKGVKEKKVIQEYEAERAAAIKQGQEKLQAIEEDHKEMGKQKMVEAEENLTQKESAEADALLKEI